MASKNPTLLRNGTQKWFKVITLGVFLILGCAHGQVGNLPALVNSDESAEIFVVREDNILGGAVITTIAIDGTNIAAIECGEYVRLKINPGNHTFSVNVFLSLPDSLQYDIKPRSRYYIKVYPTFSKFHIEIIGAEEGEKMVHKSAYIPLSQ
jgi:hypothetical protein